MASNISNAIEQFILSVIGEDESIQLSRNELANYFSVSPSQINYVLETRFNLDKGYIIESRRGGGGYVTVLKIPYSQDETIPLMLKEIEGVNHLTYNKASDMIDRLLREDIISENEATIIKSAISEKALAGPIKTKDIRKNVFKEILVGLMRR
ncbi:MAG: CtsR family transcriptional regulator [Christensenella sp.]|nr:CtsR family transcriptional regulator [Christensenella sp.]